MPLEENRLLEKIRQGQLMVIDSHCRNGLIVCKKYHAEFAGPGAIVGGNIDLDCESVLPLGAFQLLEDLPSHEGRQIAYKIRRQWIRFLHQFTKTGSPDERVQKIKDQFEHFFDHETISHIPDAVFAMMVGGW